jgi:secondary thiamine-phosphate synthase enzyme
MLIKNHIIQLNTEEGISVFDITEQIRECIKSTDIGNGFAIVCSRHTTTAVTINEHEERLLQDLKMFFTQLIPPTARYLHNDIHLRDCPPDEPENAHSHIAAVIYGSSESIPIEDGQLALGQYQSVMLIELDGPRDRQVNIQFIGE